MTVIKRMTATDDLLKMQLKDSKDIRDKSAVIDIFRQIETIFIGPESDHWLCLSVTH